MYAGFLVVPFSPTIKNSKRHFSNSISNILLWARKQRKVQYHQKKIMRVYALIRYIKNIFIMTKIYRIEYTFQVHMTISSSIENKRGTNRALTHSDTNLFLYCIDALLIHNIDYPLYLDNVLHMPFDWIEMCLQK